MPVRHKNKKPPRPGKVFLEKARRGDKLPRVRKGRPALRFGLAFSLLLVGGAAAFVKYGGGVDLTGLIEAASPRPTFRSPEAPLKVPQAFVPSTMPTPQVSAPTPVKQTPTEVPAMKPAVAPAVRPIAPVVTPATPEPAIPEASVPAPVAPPSTRPAPTTLPGQFPEAWNDLLNKLQPH